MEFGDAYYLHIRQSAFYRRCTSCDRHMGPLHESKQLTLALPEATVFLYARTYDLALWMPAHLGLTRITPTHPHLLHAQSQLANPSLSRHYNDYPQTGQRPRKERFKLQVNMPCRKRTSAKAGLNMQQLLSSHPALRNTSDKTPQLNRLLLWMTFDPINAQCNMINK